MTSTPILRWKNPLGPGVLYVRWMPSGEGWLWTSIGNSRQTTCVRWPQSPEGRRDRLGLAVNERTAYDAGMKVLQHRAILHLHPELRPVEPVAVPTAPVYTLYKTIELFEAAIEYPKLSPNVQDRTTYMYRHYLLPGGDMVIEYETLLQRLIDNRAALTLAPVTQVDLVLKLREYLNFLVEIDALKRSPLKAFGGVPPMPDIEDPTPASPEDIATLITYYADRPRGHHMRLLVEFMYATGMRVGEVLKMRWEHISATEIYIIGKPVGRKGRKPKPKDRWFPLVDDEGRETVPGLLAIIEELRRDEHRFNGRVWPWTGSNTGRCKSLWDTCKKLNLHVTSHMLRKAAEHRWEYELGLPSDLIEDLAGHTNRVRRKRYRRQPTPEDLRAKVGHAAR